MWVLIGFNAMLLESLLAVCVLLSISVSLFTGGAHALLLSERLC